MFIRAKQDHRIPTHQLKKGRCYDLETRQAEELIAKGLAVAVESERAIEEWLDRETTDAVVPKARSRRTKKIERAEKA